jgi:hypothetical protein
MCGRRGRRGGYSVSVLLNKWRDISSSSIDNTIKTERYKKEKTKENKLKTN